MILNHIGLIGDIHTQAQSLATALSVLRDRPVDAVFCTGDIVDGGGDVDECCRHLMEQDVRVVRGNHDQWFLKNQMRDLPEATPPNAISSPSLAFLRSLPATIEFDTPRGPGLLCHGIGANDMARVNPDDEGYALDCNEDLRGFLRSNHYRFLLNGHTHRKMMRRFGGCTLINPGTLTPWHDPCFLFIDFKAGMVQFYIFLNEQKLSKGPEIPLASIQTEILI